MRADNQHGLIAFDTDRDFSDREKEAMRVVDIPPLGKRDFCVQIKLPAGLERQTLEMRVELWSPGRRTWHISPVGTIALFYRSDWGSGVDVIKKEDLIATVFISYSWFSAEHIRWVDRLAQELARRQIKAVIDQKDLALGQQITKFMEWGANLPVCVCICSSAYTQKANGENVSGVGYETSLLSSQIFQGRLRGTVIPVTRDNPEKKLPDFMGSAKYLDMDTEQWQGRLLTELAAAIIKASTK